MSFDLHEVRCDKSPACRRAVIFIKTWSLVSSLLLGYHHRENVRSTNVAAGVTDKFGLLTEVLVRPTRVVEAHADVLRNSTSPKRRQSLLGTDGALASGSCTGMPQGILRS